MTFNATFWKDKRVLVTGHTGFKGAWLCAILSRWGATVGGLSLPAPRRTSLAWDVSHSQHGLIEDMRADVRAASDVRVCFEKFKPDVVFHLAAQALVMESYADFEGTWAANVMGSLNVFQAAASVGAKAIVAVTSDKCYKNKSWAWGYRESDELGGHDPYSSSKAACEILVDSWRSSVGIKSGICIGSCRAGNVIGGGDNSPGRILPDMLSAFARGVPGRVRNPSYTRPFQHVLEPLAGYLLAGRRLFEQSKGGPAYDEAFNFGPGIDGEKSVGWLADQAARYWGVGASVQKGEPDPAGLEASILMLDSSKATKKLGWSPKWDAGGAVRRSVEWEKARLNGDAWQCMKSQIDEYFQT